MLRQTIFLILKLIEDGNISADSFSLSVAGDFDYAADYLNNGTLSISKWEVISAKRSNSNFAWHANNSSGKCFFYVYDFFNKGRIDVANDYSRR